jgi:GIY-YIG catalytic domain
MSTETTAGLVTIYALTDPDSGEVRYVGRTAQNPRRRYTQHLSGAEHSTRAWARRLRRRHRWPQLAIIEADVPVDEGNHRERYWIAYWREQGADLLNDAPNPKPHPRDRGALSCTQCGHRWFPLKGVPQKCPACHSRLWRSRTRKSPGKRGRPRLFSVAPVNDAIRRADGGACTRPAEQDQRDRYARELAGMYQGRTAEEGQPA